jgi:phage host-nuclease inhibitor protein Gam
MAIEKVLGPLDLPEDDIEDVEIEIINPDAVSIEDEDGSITIDFSGEMVGEILGPDHSDNLAEFIDDDILKEMASELVGDFMNDRTSREDWARAYVKGLDLLGMKVEDRTIPWQGASGVFHPVLTEAVVRFQAQAMGELCPASGPARTKIMGRETPEIQDQAVRVETELNYQITEEMTEYRDEMEQLLFRTALAGSGFKKVYYDPLYERPCAMFVPAEDMVVGYGATDLQRCDRYTHVMKKTANEIAELQFTGFYRDVDLPSPGPDITDIQEKYNEMMGVEEVLDDDDRHTILEMHVTMNMPEEFDDPDGIARPYVVTEDIKPMDPVTENMAMLKQEPVKAFMYQDHEAHIRVHMAAMQDPKIQQIVGQSPFAAAIQSAAAAHLTEHVAMQYRVEIQKQLGVEMPDPEAKLPEDVEREVSRLAAEAADRLLGKNQAEAAQQAAQAAQNDPLTQIQRAELQLEERRVALEEAKAKHQALVDKEKLDIERIRAAGNLQVQEDRLEAENQRTAAQIGARLATQLDAREGKERMKGAEIGLKVAENILKGAENGTNRGTETQD